MKLGLSSILTIIFVLAKLGGFVHWSWWLVFSPALVSIGIGLVVLTAIVVLSLILAAGEKKGVIPNGTLQRAVKSFEGSR